MTGDHATSGSEFRHVAEDPLPDSPHLCIFSVLKEVRSPEFRGN